METILQRLEFEPSYCLQQDEKQLRRDAAAEIRRLTLENQRLMETAEMHHRLRIEAEQKAAQGAEA
ncbi:hypothetical protein MNJPNG_04770 [Cupriavidus oxalaticus]|uniref:hypothetical protein n=1 Tax=Cupriavidus oxalaticus TaxID=96344 RepID=UPI003F73284C